MNSRIGGYGAGLDEEFDQVLDEDALEIQSTT